MFIGGNDGWGLFESLCCYVKPDIADDRDLERAYLDGGFVSVVLGVADRYLNSLGVQRLSGAVDRYLSAVKKITDAAPSSCKKQLLYSVRVYRFFEDYVHQGAVQQGAFAALSFLC